MKITKEIFFKVCELLSENDVLSIYEEKKNSIIVFDQESSAEFFFDKDDILIESKESK